MLTRSERRVDEFSENINRHKILKKKPVSAEEYSNYNEKHTRGTESR